jgi:hypothetical protein
MRKSTDAQPPPAMNDIVGEAGKDQFFTVFIFRPIRVPHRVSDIDLPPKYEHSDEFPADPQAFWDAMRPMMLKPPCVRGEMRQPGSHGRRLRAR